MRIILLLLTCANNKEADIISQTLLKKRLIVCAKKVKTSTQSLWKGSIESAKEVLLIMDSIESNFSKIEKIVNKFHSYKTFVLVATPVTKTTNGVIDWVNKEIEK